jgi:DNA-binding NarL/FixJ family response regulator
MKDGLTKIILVDDHVVVRTGLAHLLNELETVEIVGEASNGQEFLELLKNTTPDIVLMDINMPVMDGIEATRQALEIYPELKILVLSMYSDEEYYFRMVDLGVKGFVLKEADHNEIEQAIVSIMANRPFFSQSLLLNLLRKKNEIANISITSREKDILRLLSKGLSSSEIAENLFLSLRTVERSRSDLLQKTETGNSIGLVLFAIKNKLIELE